jgi:hypothetical protein
MLAAITAVALLIASCGSDPGTSGPLVFFPQHDIGSGPLAGLDGTLEVRDGCIWAIGGPDRYLVLWPRGTQLRLDANNQVEVVGPAANGTTLRSGDAVFLVGGESKDEAFVRGLIGADIPDACRSPTYWLATEIRSEPLPDP